MGIHLRSLVVLAVAIGVFAEACDSEADRRGSGSTSTQNGTGGTGGSEAVCSVAADCYPGLDQAALGGEVLCLDRVRGGYCTHFCETDADCCAVPGECDPSIAQVCARFESTGQRVCLVRCEAEDWMGSSSDWEFCHDAASPYFTCRAAGATDPKACYPGFDCGLGDGCNADSECEAGLTCLGPEQASTGYCGKHGCQADADCPPDWTCVVSGNESHCQWACAADNECGACFVHQGETPSCVEGVCSLTCIDNWGNCDDDVTNGCETSLITTDNCGECGNACSGNSCINGICG